MRLTILIFCTGLVCGCWAQPKDTLALKPPGHSSRYFFFPLVVKSPEYKWGAGGGGIIYFKLKADSVTRTSNTKFVSFFTLRKQLVFASEGNIYAPEESFIIHYTASVSNFPDKFWGVGNKTPSSSEEDYTITQFDLYPQVLDEVRPHLFVGIGYEFQNVFRFQYDAQNGESVFDRENILGRKGGRISGGGYILTWDSRNNAFSSSKGFYVQYFETFYRRLLGSDFEFSIQSLDARKYFDLRHNQVIAFQMNMLSANGSIPIRNLSIIGSDSYMRGYYQGRYQDRAMFALQAEFRTPVYKRWGVVVFTGMGKVGPRVIDVLSFSSLKPSAGLGIRFAINSAEKLNMRFDTGFGLDTHGSYLNMGEAF